MRLIILTAFALLLMPALLAFNIRNQIQVEKRLTTRAQMEELDHGGAQ